MNPTPTIRYIKGKPVTFYSPQQLCELVPIDKRQPAQRDTTVYKDNHINYVRLELSRTGRHHQ